METSADRHEVLRQMNKVRQVRQYRDEPIDQASIDALLEVARWTGSSRNQQPWHFIVVNDKALLKQLSQFRDSINWLADAPLGIAIALNGGDATQEAYDEGRVTERVMVAAHMLGLGSGVAWFLGDENESTAKKLLGVPNNYTLHSIIAIGRAISAKDPRPNANTSGRKPLEEIVSYNRMSGS